MIVYNKLTNQKQKKKKSIIHNTIHVLEKIIHYSALLYDISIKIFNAQTKLNFIATQ